MRYHLWMIPLGLLGIPTLVVASFRIYGLKAGKTRPTEARTRMRELVRLPLKSPSLRILKGERRLELWEGTRLVKTYPVALGLWPWHDKIKEGDFRTPLGTFYVCTRNERSPYHRFLGLSYPDVTAADRGWAQKLITPEQRERILKAQARRECPPWDTGLGGAIGIHGGGALFFHWTRGCIAVDNPDIEELWEVCPIGTPVRIEP
jgi:murein L,D-transpeptidase YafK